MSRLPAVLAAVLGLTLSACQPVVGKLTVVRKLVLELAELDRPVPVGCLVRDDCGDPVVRRVSASFHPGTYDARMNMDAVNAIQLKIDNGAGRHAVVSLEIPEQVSVPKSSGRFALSARESGQIFDIEGTVHTVESSSPTVAGWEQCYASIKRRTCGYGRYPDKKDKSSFRCRHMYETVFGRRAVEFHHVVNTKTVTLEFKGDGTEENIAWFSGSAARKHKVYDDWGRCEIDNLFVRHSVW